MFKTDLTKFGMLFFDIESVPCSVTGKRIYDFEHTDEEETIQLMYDSNEIALDDRSSMLKILMQKIVSISGLSRNNDKGKIKYNLITASLDASTEKEIIERFMSGVSNRFLLCGFASKIFDLPILAQRALITGASNRSFFFRKQKSWDDGIDYFDRYGESHIDLCDYLGFGNMRPKLHEIAQACGIPGKLGIDGGDVKDLYLKGDFKTIENYNQVDVATTYLLWLRFMLTSGFLTPEQYRLEDLQFKEFLTERSNDNELFGQFIERREHLKSIKF